MPLHPTGCPPGVPYVRFDPDNPAGLEFGISQILAVPHHGTKPPSTLPKRTHPLGDRADEFLARLRGREETIPEAEFKEIIAQAIRESGVTSVSTGDGEPRYLDFAVWSDDLSPWVGNPLAIELRRTVRGASDVNAAVGRLTQAMTRGSMSWGLLIYLRSPIDVEAAITAPNIVSISAERFLDALRGTGFGELVRSLRSQRISENC